MSDTPSSTDFSPEARGSQNARWRTLSKPALAVLAIVAVYWPAVRGEFIWDDALLVSRNPLLQGEFNLGSVWFQTDFPLTLVVLWIQWLAWGNDPTGYHVVNVLLHAANALLLWSVLNRLKVRGAGLAAAIFAVHPVCVASVAWISELKNTLSLAFFLLSFRWYLDFRASFADRQPGKINSTFLLSLGAFLLALLSKTSTVMLPVVLLGCAWWQRGRISRSDLLHTTPYFLLALVFSGLTIWFQNQMLTGGDPVQTENFGGRLAGAGMALWFYLGKAVVPLHLNTIYARWKLDPVTPLDFLPALLWAGGLALCWVWRRGWGRHAFFALGCFTVLLFPVLGFFDMYFLALSRVSDHFQYLPLIAVIALGAAGMHSLFGRGLQIAAIALVLVLSVLTWHRARVFANDESLWRDTLAKNPRAWNAQNNLGCVLAQQEKYGEAMGFFLSSLETNPRNAGAHCNLARVLFLQGKAAEAESHFQTALAIKPNDADVLRSYASALAALGKTDEAVRHLRHALQRESNVESHLQLAALLYQTRKFPEAAVEYRQVLKRQPDSLDALNNLAWLLATCSDPLVRNGNEAVRLAERACDLTHRRQPRTLGILAAAYAEAGRFAEATRTAAAAVEQAAAAGDIPFARMNQQLLELYRDHKPYHQ